MGDLFGLLRNRVDANARHAVDVYARELAEYRSMATDTRGRAAMLDFAVVLRRRTVALAAENRPFADEDLALMDSVGKERAEKGVSLASHRRVLALHSTLTLREIHDVVGPDDLDDLMQMLGWLGPQGTAAQQAYTRGYMEGQKRLLPFVTRVQLLAKMLLTDDPAAAGLAQSLGMPICDHYAVTVVRIAGGPSRPGGETRDEIVEVLLEGDPVPITWEGAEEFVMLVPGNNGGQADASASAGDRALSLAHDLAEMIGRPCSVGMATGRVPALAAAASLARQVSRAAPIQAIPRRLHTIADVFVELGTAQLPNVDQWLREVAGLLSSGPDLVATLDAYYRNDMNRLRTAASLHIHPRTLDYRLRRVRDLTGMDPGSTQGVRVLNTTVARILADAWPEFR